MNKDTKDDRVLQKKIKTRIINADEEENILIVLLLLIKTGINENGSAMTAYSDAKFLMLSVEPGLVFD
ncbi:MAG: hypothetical protein NTU73_01740 [Ignavibacteriae bacterium]|nr:hypothetical protein [Ignavibacteriota bacterium]